MEAQLFEPGVILSQEYAKSFVSKIPTDSRFLQNTFREIMPSSTIDSKVITFDLPKFEAANVYDISEVYIRVKINILKADNTLPTEVVSLTNNISHSLFESVRLYINDYLVSNAAKDYPYKVSSL